MKRTFYTIIPGLGTRSSAPPAIDWFARLPDEIVLQLLSFLDIESLSEACCVCRQWRALGEDDALWRPLLQRVYGSEWESRHAPLPGCSWKSAYAHYGQSAFRQAELRKIAISRRLFTPFELSAPDRKALHRALSASGLCSELRSATRVTYDDFNFLRDNPHLVELVEEGSYPDISIVRIPASIKWCVKSSEGMEWVEEKHERFKKALEPTPQAFGFSAGTTVIVVDVSTCKGLDLTDAALRMLCTLTGKDVAALQSIPRHHPALIQTLRTLGRGAGESLRIIKVPAHIEWWVAAVANREFVCQAYRVWPADLTFRKERIAFGDLLGHRLTARHLTPEAWDTIGSATGVALQFAGEELNHDSDDEGRFQNKRGKLTDGKDGDFFTELTLALERRWSEAHREADSDAL